MNLYYMLYKAPAAHSEGSIVEAYDAESKVSITTDTCVIELFANPTL